MQQQRGVWRPRGLLHPGQGRCCLELAITTCSRVQKCVCELGAIESYGQCVPLQSLDCGDTLNLTKVGHCSTAALQHCSTAAPVPHPHTAQVMDTSSWGVSPYCLAWGNSSVHGDESGRY